MAKVIDRHWRAAAVWCLIAAVASACGIIHGFVFTPDGGYAPALSSNGPASAARLPPDSISPLAMRSPPLLLFAMHALETARDRALIY